MIIDLDNKTRISGTERCWEIQRHRNYMGGKRWEPHKWSATFRQTLEEIVHREIRIHPAHGVSEAILAMAETIERFEQLIPSEYRLSK